MKTALRPGHLCHQVEDTRIMGKQVKSTAHTPAYAGTGSGWAG